MRSQSLLLCLAVTAASCGDPPIPPAPADLSVYDLAVPPDLARRDLAGAVDLMKPDLAGALHVASFGNPMTVTTSCAANGYLLVADFNHDGKPDLAILDGAQTCVLLGNGDGSFKMETTYATPAFGFTTTAQGLLFDPDQVAAADYNGDKNLDLVCGREGGFYLLIGKGDGTFAAPVQLARQMGNTAGFGLIAAGDFNNDGKADVATNSYARFVELWPGNGDGTFQAPLDWLGQGGGAAVGNLVVGNLKGNGKLDGVGLQVIVGSRWLFASCCAAGKLPNNIGLPIPIAHPGDLNGDGQDDMVLITDPFNGGGNNKDVRATSGSDFTTTLIATDPFVEGLVLADIDADGVLDVVTPTRAWLNLGVKGQIALAAVVVYGVGISTTTPAAGDLDRDGRADIVEWTKNGLVSRLSTSQ